MSDPFSSIDVQIRVMYNLLADKEALTPGARNTQIQAITESLALANINPEEVTLGAARLRGETPIGPKGRKVTPLDVGALFTKDGHVNKSKLEELHTMVQKARDVAEANTLRGRATAAGDRISEAAEDAYWKASDIGQDIGEVARGAAEAAGRGAVAVGKGAAAAAAAAIVAPVVLAKGTVDMLGMAAASTRTALAEAKNKLQPLLDKCSQAATWVGARAQAGFEVIRKGLQAVKDWLVGRFQALGNMMWPVFEPVFGPVFSALQRAVDAVTPYARAAGKAVVSAAETVGKALHSAAEAVGNSLYLAIGNCVVSALIMGPAIMGWMRQVTFDNVYNGILAAAESLRAGAAQIPAKLAAAKKVVDDAFASFGKDVQQTLRSAYDSASNNLQAASDAVKAFGRGTAAAWNKNVQPHLNRAGEGIRDFASEVAGHLRETTTSALNGLSDLLKKANKGLQVLPHRIFGVKVTAAERKKVLAAATKLNEDMAIGLDRLVGKAGDDAVKSKEFKYATEKTWWPRNKGAMEETRATLSEWSREKPAHTPEEALARLTAIRNGLGALLAIETARAAAAPGEVAAHAPAAAREIMEKAEEAGYVGQWWLPGRWVDVPL